MNRSRRAWVAAIAASVIGASLVAAPGRASADGTGLKWAVEGYFRTRTVYLTNLAPQDRYISVNPAAPDDDNQIVIPDIRKTSYIYSRGRLLPSVSYKKLAKFTAQLDVLNDVLWGDNNGIASAPLFATDGSNQSYLGGDQVNSIDVKRAWVEFQMPLGVMRVGRMPSHWGMGLLANGGGTGTFDPTAPAGEPPRKIGDNFVSEDFGEKHFGSSADRILFVTKPITIYKTLAKQGNTESPLVMGYAYDKLSEAPFEPFEPSERAFRPFGQQGFISRGKDDDINEHVAFVVWNDPEWKSDQDYRNELRLGLYGVLRTAREGSTAPTELTTQATCGTFDGVATPCKDTGSKVYIGDVWWRVRYGALFTEGEGYYIGGSTFGGIPFPARNQKKDASISAGVARFGYLTDAWDAILEVGHASGDKDLGDEHFSQRAIHPDFNVGLVLYEETLRELTARVYGVPLLSAENPNGATGFFSNGGVINSNYLFPHGRWRPPSGNLEVYGGLLMAWVDQMGVSGITLFDASKTSSTYLGTELDLGVRTEFAHNMRFAIETGFLTFGDALKSQLPNADSSFTLQTSLGFVF